ncbi:unnamed protein product [Trifolium pratense]|uniref:Uncharacterized protein n=1 Tax=Trifolium pratense TaxID=57577 RepID=A0ACB0IHY1_TRIPR|nr:unnamed protein product [Trifolium pratense]
MDCLGHNQNPPTLSVGSADQWPFGFILCHPNHIISPAGAQLGQHQLAYQLIQQQQQLQQQLQTFWANQYQEIGKVTDFKNHSLPLARIKKIMKADEDVRMVLTVFGTKLHL